jgi:hypothetical protein
VDAHLAKVISGEFADGGGWLKAEG